MAILSNTTFNYPKEILGKVVKFELFQEKERSFIKYNKILIYEFYGDFIRWAPVWLASWPELVNNALYLVESLVLLCMAYR
jgi:hypothetical protein